MHCGRCQQGGTFESRQGCQHQNRQVHVPQLSAENQGSADDEAADHRGSHRDAVDEGGDGGGAGGAVFELLNVGFDLVEVGFRRVEASGNRQFTGVHQQSLGTRAELYLGLLGGQLGDASRTDGQHRTYHSGQQQAQRQRQGSQR